MGKHISLLKIIRGCLDDGAPTIGNNNTIICFDVVGTWNYVVLTTVIRLVFLGLLVVVGTATKLLVVLTIGVEL